MTSVPVSIQITPEVITLAVFVLFALCATVCMSQLFKQDFVWAGLCGVGAVCFVFGH